MAESNEQVEVRTVSLYPEDWLEVDTLAKVSGAGVSAAMRRIIREWRELREPKAAGDRRMANLVEGYSRGLLTNNEFLEAARLEQLRAKLESMRAVEVAGG